MKYEIKKLKNSIAKLKREVEILPNPNTNLQIEFDLNFKINELLKKTLVNYCIAEINESSYNNFILDIEHAIHNLKEKCKNFNTKFNKTNIIKSLIEDYKDDSSINNEKEVLIFIQETHNKELDKYLNTSIINFFRNRLSKIDNISNKEESLRIPNLN